MRPALFPACGRRRNLIVCTTLGRLRWRRRPPVPARPAARFSANRDRRRSPGNRLGGRSVQHGRHLRAWPQLLRVQPSRPPSRLHDAANPFKRKRSIASSGMPLPGASVAWHETPMLCNCRPRRSASLAKFSLGACFRYFGGSAHCRSQASTSTVERRRPSATRMSPERVAARVEADALSWFGHPAGAGRLHHRIAVEFQLEAAVEFGLKNKPIAQVE